MPFENFEAADDRQAGVLQNGELPREGGELLAAGAAEEFREAHDLEPDRWVKAGNGFRKAAAALTTYAGALEDAQRRAAAAKAEHERGQRESESARTQYDSYLGRMRAYWSQGGTDQAEPFVDWGDPIQQEALRALQSARADLDNAAAICAGEVRAGCADAPEEPNWLESGLKFVGGIFEGAGEAVWDLLTMVPFSPVNLVIDSYKLATGDLTPEELAKKYELSVENGWAMAQGVAETAATPEADKDTLLAAIRQREAQLAAEEKRLADRKQTLAVSEAKLAEQLAAFEKARANLEKTLAMADQAAERDLARMTTVYENMKPGEAAKIFETMDVGFAAGLLARMRPDVAAQVLTGMKPEAAYAVTLTIASRNAAVPTD